MCIYGHAGNYMDEPSLRALQVFGDANQTSEAVSSLIKEPLYVLDRLRCRTQVWLILLDHLEVGFYHRLVVGAQRRQRFDHGQHTLTTLEQ